ncbi:MAG: Ig-like domain repeat protein, partial [Ignavibacteria bacterium]
NAGGTPTGSVTFFDGVTPLGNVSLTGDSAQVSSASLSSASHTIKAVYSGDSNFKSDSTTITQVVGQTSPTVTLASSVNPSTFGQNVTFKAKVDNASGTPTGSVTFYDGATSLGNVSLVGDSAQVSSASLSSASHTIKAVYSGDSNFKSDSATVTQVVNQAAPA